MNTTRTGALALLAALFAAPAAGQTGDLRPMTWMDVQEMSRAGSWAPSGDGKWMLYTVTTPRWEDAESYSDVHLVSMQRGAASSRQMTFTETKNESSPAWSPDGTWFVFRSDRDAPNGGSQNQLYMMRPDGGEARKITDAKDGVGDFRFSPDGKWLVYRAGKSGEQQLWRMPVADIEDAEPRQLTRNAAGIEDWEFAPDARAIWFVRPDTVFSDEKKRREKKFTVDVKNAVTPIASLWMLELEPRAEKKMAGDASYSVSGFEISPDGKWVGFNGSSSGRYQRNVTEERMYADLYLLEVASGRIERLTSNDEVGESGPSFSPDSRWIAFSAPDDLTRYTMTENRVYLREVGASGQPFRKLGSSHDGSVSVGFWSADGKTIYFNGGIKVTNQLFALDVAKDEVRQITRERASIRVSRHDESGTILIDYSDPKTPPTVFAATRLDQVTDRSKWVQLVDANPQFGSEIALGEEVEVEWTSTDGKTVGGVLAYPVGYEKGRRYPLIVAIHGGPASADVLGFNGGYGAQVYASHGWAVLRPNYRGSTNYGNAHRTDIVGDYFTLGYDDIMTGVDHLIAEGIVDGDRMGVLGWSAGGHWSNWILTQTDRFKAISSGAGTMNWISMYAQSDVQRNRQFYLGDGFLYDDFDTYFDQSPLKYIKNAKTPTMIHVVEGDPRVPSPQSVELHMALRKLGVDTELFMYPGRSHGIPDPRNRLVKSVSEMAWMDYYVLGKGDKFQWRQVLQTLEEDEGRRVVSEQAGGR